MIVSVLQLLAAVSVSTGCISYGICMAYTSSAIPSMLAPNNSLTIEIGTQETTWMSKFPCLNFWVNVKIGRITCSRSYLFHRFMLFEHMFKSTEGVPGPMQKSG